MIGLRVRTEDRSRAVLARTKEAGIKNLGHAGAAIRLTARRSIRRGKQPSRPGTPPHTRRGRLKRALRYVVERDRERVVVGPEHAVVGPSAMAHEFGGRYRKERFRRRAFMGPALERTRPRLPRHWAGSVR